MTACTIASAGLPMTSRVNLDETGSEVSAYMLNTGTSHPSGRTQATVQTIVVQDCRKANGVYELQEQLHNERSVWKKIGGGLLFYIFYSSKKESWYINSKLNDQGCASCLSTADSPPLGRWDRSGSAVLSTPEDLGSTEQQCSSPVYEVPKTERPDTDLKDLKDMPVFVQAGQGRLAARGAPSPGVLERWLYEAGATHVVTLLREDEPAFAKVHRRALELLEERELQGWLHIPLSGGRCVSAPSEVSRKPVSKKELQNAAQDKVSLRRMGEIAELLRQGASVVVHCAAGMHRTGIVCYMVLRLLGQSPEEALDSILRSRPVTHTEVMKTTSKHAPLYELAEEILKEHAA